MIVVTGLMRSGTSPLARMLHQGGVPMGTEMLFPVGLAGPEYEDRRIQRPLGAWLLGADPPSQTLVDTFRAYIRHRRIARPDAVVLSHPVQGWGFKTPFVAPFLTELREAARLESEPMQLLLTARPFVDTIDSLRTHLSYVSGFARDQILPQLVGLQQRFADALKNEKEAPRIPIEMLWSQPEAVRERLEQDLRIEIPESATRGIGKGRF